MIGISEVINMPLDDKDKERIVRIIRELVRLSQKARTEGLLSLDSEIHNLEPFLLRKGIELVTDGNHPNKIRDILDNLIHSGNHKGIGLLERITIREGILLVQAGNSPKLLLDTISSMLGEDFCLYIEELNLLKDYEKFFLDELEEKSFPSGEGTDLLEDRILKVSGFEEMDLLIRRVGTSDMALALRGASSDVVKHVFYHTSDRNILDDIKIIYQGIGPCKLTDIQQAQKKVADCIHI